MDGATLPALLMRKDSPKPTDLEPVEGLFGKTPTERLTEATIETMKNQLAALQTQMGAMRGIAAEFYAEKLSGEGKAQVSLKMEKDLRALGLEDDLGLLRNEDGLLKDYPKDKQPPPSSWSKQERLLKLQWGATDSFTSAMFQFYTNDALKHGF